MFGTAAIISVNLGCDRHLCFLDVSDFNLFKLMSFPSSCDTINAATMSETHLSALFGAAAAAGAAVVVVSGEQKRITWRQSEKKKGKKIIIISTSYIHSGTRRNLSSA